MKKLLGLAFLVGLGLVAASLWSGSQAEANDPPEPAQSGAKKMRGDAGVAPSPSPGTPKPPPSTGSPAVKGDAGPMK